MVGRQAPLICEVGEQGVLLPLFGDAEHRWPRPLRAILYVLSLGWCFLGVALISDVFMGAIERITARKRRRLDPRTNRHVTMLVWNSTVANLTLMALGSSAPEILLSVIELFKNKQFSGDLGPSTIVGSAAFNLFAIVAVCVVSIPSGELRVIKDLSVYFVTASFSMLAYLWLVYILVFNSPNVVTIVEGVLTLLFLPLLVVFAFSADKGWFSKVSLQPTEAVVDSEMSHEEFADLEAMVRRQHGLNLTERQVGAIIEAQYVRKSSRALYRSAATRSWMGCRRVKIPAVFTSDPYKSTRSVVPYGPEDTSIEEGSFTEICPHFKNSERSPSGSNRCGSKLVQQPPVRFYCTRVAVMESAGEVTLRILRSAGSDLDATVKVGYRTREGTAKANHDFQPANGILQFTPGETQSDITVRIIDDNAFEDDEEFYVDLFDCDSDETFTTATIVIIDDDDPGILRFTAEEVKVEEGLEDYAVEVVVERMSGSTGQVSCSYHTEDATAIAGVDYVATDGTLEFQSGQLINTIEVTIKASGRYDRKGMLRVILDKVGGGAKFDEKTDGGADSCISYVIIQADNELRGRIERLKAALSARWEKASVGHANWPEQFVEALQVNGGEDGEASHMDWAMHILLLPWKLLFAFVPPPAYLHGWACFTCALAMIGLITAVIGDFAALLGCVVTMPDEITAITLVALGTSLPDALASQSAAVQDATADASIGNVTGSNSVNVFLGLGLPWTIGSIYWAVRGPNQEWLDRYSHEDWIRGWEDGVFVVEAGALSFSVVTFSCCAMACIALLAVRRKVVGGELGGPDVSKWASAAFLVVLWIVYVSLSAGAALKHSQRRGTG